MQISIQLDADTDPAGTTIVELRRTRTHRRAHSLGHARQHLNLLGFALVNNGVTIHRYARHRPPDSLAA